MMTFALLAHWLACIWFVIGQAEQPDYSFESDIQFPGRYVLINSDRKWTPKKVWPLGGQT